ncbi:MAG: Mu transposase C-terminal domain-containing protein [Paludibacteraceae bacterium]|nr:Mu transposase C-terminal domain-containing protein [Paludibacteraceae bacterium]
MQAIEEINGRPAVSVSWMDENGVISSSNVRRLTHFGDIEQARRACKGQTAMVYADNMPIRFREKIIEKVGDIYEAMNSTIIKVEHDAKAAQFYDDYATADARRLPDEKRREYYATACVLNAVTQMLSVTQHRQSSIGVRKAIDWQMVQEQIDKVDSKMFPFKLPGNARSLERKWQAYKSEGYESLVHKNYKSGSGNARKIVDDEQEKALVELLTVQNWDMEQVAKLYNAMAKSNGWKQVTATTIANFAKSHATDIHAARHGRNSFRNEVAMQVKRSRPSTPLLYWTRDGWKAELFYRTEDKLYNSLTIEVVIDTYCDYPMGYAIADRESVELINEAMRSAVKHTEELFGSMYRVHQLQSDNYGKAGMADIDNEVSAHFTPAAVGNAKAKVIEPYFKKLNHDYCALLPNWSGYGVTSKKSLQPNPELVKLRAKSFPSREECIAQLEAIIQMEREKKREQMMAGFAKMKPQHKVEMSKRDYLSLWGNETPTRALLRGEGLMITIGGVKRTYDCFDAAMRRHPAERWAVKYDPRDLSKVLAISEDGRLVYELEEKYLQPMALADRRDGDYEQLKRVRDFNQELESRAIKTVSESSGTIARLMSSKRLDDGENPLIIDGADTYQKMLLTDQHGRHKDALNDIRCGEQPKNTHKSQQDETEEDNVYNDY